MPRSITIPARELLEFASALFTAGKVPPAEAQLVSESLVDANLRGHESHGVIRIPDYLDQLTSGPPEHRHLQAQFKQRSVIKEYTALVDGWIEPPAGRINAPIGRHPTARKRMAVLLPHPATGKMRGRAALTEFETVARYAGSATTGENLARFSLLRVLLHTGRTHQIRVHLAWHKFPITGDTLYGYNRRRLPIARHFLHAAKLTLALPSTETAVEFSAPLPEELQRQLDALAAAV